jgi:hypothetical protein
MYIDMYIYKLIIIHLSLYLWIIKLKINQNIKLSINQNMSSLVIECYKILITISSNGLIVLHNKPPGSTLHSLVHISFNLLHISPNLLHISPNLLHISPNLLHISPNLIIILIHLPQVESTLMKHSMPSEEQSTNTKAIN